MEERKNPAPQPQEGRRLTPGQGLSRGGRIAIAVTAAAVALLAAGYLGLCAYASGDRALPNTTLAGVELGGLSRAQAEEKLSQDVGQEFETLEVPIRVGEETVVFSAREAGAKAVWDSEELVRAGKGSFFTSGWNYLAGLLGRENPVGDGIELGNEDYVARTLERVAAAVDQPVEQSRWELDQETGTLTLYRGRTGQSVDREQVLDGVRAALADRGGQVEARIARTAP